MSAKLGTRIVSLAATLAVVAAGTALAAPTATAADTEVKRVGATIIYKNVANPTRPGNCGSLVILEWTDPQVKGFEPTGWTGHYFAGAADARVEKTITGTPPFNNTQDISTVNFYAPAGTNWFQIGWKSRAASPAAGYPLDCSDQVATLQGLYGTQAWVDVTGTVSNSTTAGCLQAREAYDSARQKVNQLRRDLRKARTDSRKAVIRNRLDTAITKRARAAAGLGRACNG
jgi:hypothetical protein